MATTRLMPLHTGKGRTVGQAISDIIDYTENPQKTTTQVPIHSHSTVRSSVTALITQHSVNRQQI